MKKVLSIALVAFATALLAAMPTLAATISVVPSSATANVGDTLVFDIVVDPMGDIVSAFDFTMSFDDTVISLTNVSFGSGLDLGTAGMSFQDFITGSGFVNLAELSLWDDASLLAAQGGGPVTIASLTFSAIAAGTTTLDFVLGTVPGVSGIDVKGALAAQLDPTGTGAPITVRGGTPPIPEPAAIGVFGVGALLVACALGRRRA
jgi:hypothetical protein